MEKQTYSVTDVTRILGLSRPAVYRYIKAGKLPVIDLGGKKLIPRHAIDTLLHGNTVQSLCKGGPE